VAKTDRCPICGVSVKSENLIRHLNDNHPRHPDTPALREKLKSEPGRTPRKASARPIHVRKWQVALVATIVLGGIGAYYLVSAATQPFPCVTVAETQLLYHWHAQMNIFSGGAPVTIPAYVGLSAVCAEPLHTHDATGRIHIETNVNRLYSVSDFFRVWGKSFGNPNSMLVNGTAAASDPGRILYDGERIDLYYTLFS
jgi:hypothetical protein